ncbi:MAG TPA: YebC/PmpR family DNA-binding transcriptional regulator [Candidatus Paceibacterota bacterium]
MSGHNKWSKIKHKKAATDSERSKIFGKYARSIAVESKKSGGDIYAPGLRLAIERARKENMPNENIERAIAKGKADTGVSLEAVTYETYGPGGTALIIEGFTDNSNRTSQEIKHLLSQHGATLAQPGSALWAFVKQDGEWVPQTTVSLSEGDREKIERLKESLEEHDDVQDVYTNAV